MNITFMLSPITVLTRYPVSSRILSSNLLKDKRFNVNFYNASLNSYVKCLNIFEKDYLPKIEKIKTSRSEIAKMWSGNRMFNRFTLLELLTGRHDKKMIEKIKTEYVLFSAPTVMDFNFVKSLLIENKKVVLGGSSCQIYTPAEIRKILMDSDVPENKLKNLIVVSGYVDMETDLYKIISNWKDHIITENNFKTMWDAEDDFIHDHIRVMKHTFNPSINILLNSRCWWGKCRFCTHRALPCISFAEDMSVDELVEYIDRISKKYFTNRVFFNDSYLVNTPKTVEFMQRLTDKGYFLEFYTGIQLLKRPSYIDFINKCNINVMYIGMETTNDFQLDFIKKGFKRKDIFETVDLMINNMNKKTQVSLFSMIDLPVENEKDIIENWETQAKIRNKFIDNKMICRFAFSPLRYFPKTDLLGDLIQPAREDQMDKVIGVWNIYKFYEEIGMDISGISKAITMPLIRYTPDGKILKSDVYYMNSDIRKQILWK